MPSLLERFLASNGEPSAEDVAILRGMAEAAATSVPRFEGTDLIILGDIRCPVDHRGQYVVPASHMRVFVAYVTACEAAAKSDGGKASE